MKYLSFCNLLISLSIKSSRFIIGPTYLTMLFQVQYNILYKYGLHYTTKYLDILHKNNWKTSLKYPHLFYIRIEVFQLIVFHFWKTQFNLNSYINISSFCITSKYTFKKIPKLHKLIFCTLLICFSLQVCTYYLAYKSESIIE